VRRLSPRVTTILMSLEASLEVFPFFPAPQFDAFANY
jgi:hypothetical protein